jgi:hypothetical protein
LNACPLRRRAQGRYGLCGGEKPGRTSRVLLEPLDSYDLFQRGINTRVPALGRRLAPAAVVRNSHGSAARDEAGAARRRRGPGARRGVAGSPCRDLAEKIPALPETPRAAAGRVCRVDRGGRRTAP